MPKNRKRYILLSLVTLLILSTTACQPAAPQPVDDGSPWYTNQVFYQVFVRSFYDSNGDGVGDFNGLTQKLDYLNDGKAGGKDLGVTGLWLMPIHPSASYHGYDVTDYLAINPLYGTMDDFKAFLQAAHNRGIKVIIDFVVNHTSIKHPWFGAALENAPQYRDYYIWSDQDPSYLGPWGQDVWYPTSTGYYYAIFWEGMPDLNYRNPAVQQEVDQIAKYWLVDLGVDGLRFDGAKHIVEEGEVQANSPSTLQWFVDFHQYLKSIAPNSMTVGEVWDPSTEAVKYVKNGGLDLVFNFDLASALTGAATFRDARSASQAYLSQKRTFESYPYAAFLSNHDQNRVMSLIGGDWEKAKVAATLLLTSPGVPFIYYGEEIGMLGTKPDEQIRTPMLWSADKNAGFTTGNPWFSINADYKDHNVAVMQQDPNSLWSHYQALITLRSQHQALRQGEYFQVLASNPRVFAALRISEYEAVLILVNFGNEPITDFTLKWDATPLRGSYSTQTVFGKPKLNRFTVGGQGELQNYAPLKELPANAHIVVVLNGK